MLRSSGQMKRQARVGKFPQRNISEGADDEPAWLAGDDSGGGVLVGQSEKKVDKQ